MEQLYYKRVNKALDNLTLRADKVSKFIGFSEFPGTLQKDKGRLYIDFEDGLGNYKDLPFSLPALEVVFEGEGRDFKELVEAIKVKYERRASYYYPKKEVDTHENFQSKVRSIISNYTFDPDRIKEVHGIAELPQTSGTPGLLMIEYKDSNWNPRRVEFSLSHLNHMFIEKDFKELFTLIEERYERRNFYYYPKTEVEEAYSPPTANGAESFADVYKGKDNSGQVITATPVSVHMYKETEEALLKTELSLYDQIDRKYLIQYSKEDYKEVFSKVDLSKQALKLPDNIYDNYNRRILLLI